MNKGLVGTLFVASFVVLPSFGQQKTYNWVAGDDETVSLDPGYYHGGPALQPSLKMAEVHVDVDAERPVTVAMVSAEEWNDDAQHPEALRDLRYICTQEHVVKATYTCTPPSGVAVTIVIRDERVSEQGTFSGLGEVIEHHERRGQNGARTSEEFGGELSRHRMREFLAPNSVHLQYYDWACTDNCNLPDPPQSKLFNWVPSQSESVRLDPANYYTSHTYQPGPQGGNMQVYIESRYPITVAMIDPPTWTDATERPTEAKNTSNIQYSCVQQHLMTSMYTCHMGGFWPQVLVIRDERNAVREDHDGDRGQSRNNPNANAAPHVVPVSAGGSLSGSPARQFTAPNDVRIQYYSWNCVQACDQPDFGWVRQVKEKYELTKVLKLYGGLVADHDGAPVSIKVKSPVPMAVAVLPAQVAGQLYGKPDMLESALASSSCQQRGVQDSTFQCTFNLADGAQSLVLLPEAGVNIPNHKKAEVEVQAVKCVDNCAYLHK